MEGYLIKRGNYFYTKINLGKNENGETIYKQINTKCTDIKSAENVLKEILKDELNLNLDLLEITLSQFLTEFLETHKVERCTKDGYNSILRIHITPYFGEDFKLKELTTLELTNYISDKIAEGQKAVSVLKHISLLKKACKKACALGLLKNNPCIDLELPKKERYEIKNLLTSDQVQKLLEVSKYEEIGSFVYLCCLLGLRRGEALGLKWNSIDFETGEIYIHEILTHHASGTFHKEGGKTKKSTRKLIAPDILLEYLKFLRKKQDFEKIDIGSSYNFNNYVCVTKLGQVISPNAVSSRFKSLLTKYKLPKIRIHDLRHGNATMLYTLGIDIKSISEWLGHSSITVTSDMYVHISDKYKRKNAEVLNNMFLK